MVLAAGDLLHVGDVVRLLPLLDVVPIALAPHPHSDLMLDGLNFNNTVLILLCYFHNLNFSRLVHLLWLGE